jgi:hypothetical protein
MQSLACQALPLHELESFILTEDKRTLTADWIKSGNIGKQYLKLLNTLYTKGPSGLSEDEENLLKRWMLNSRHGEYLNPVLKYCLESIFREKDPSKKKDLMKEFNDTFLHFSFNEERDLRGLSSKTTIESEATSNKKPKQKEQVQVENSEFSIKPELLKEMSNDELIRLIKEDKSWYNFELETADLSFLKKIDWEAVVQPTRIEIAIERLPDFVFNKVKKLSRIYMEL